MATCDAFSHAEYWNEFPPMHLLLRGFVGYKGRKQIKEANWKNLNEEEMAAYKKLGIKVSPHAPPLDKLPAFVKRKIQGAEYVGS